MTEATQVSKQSEQLVTLTSENKTYNMPLSNGAIGELEFNPNKLAHKDEEFLPALIRMIAGSRRSGRDFNDYEMPLMQEAMKRHDVTINEAYEALWLAYDDPYVPATGIEWKHLWKGISEMRYGRERKFYTYSEVIKKVEQGESMDFYQIDLEEKGRVQAEHPSMDPKGIPCWRTKR